MNDGDIVKELFKKYKDVIAYLFFGGVTTLVNIVVYYLCAHVIKLSTVPSTIIAWIVAVLVAYITNRKWVFHSKVKTFKEIFHEMMTFFECRIATGVLDLLIMYVFVDVLKLNDLVIKILSNIIVIILNYVLSKLIVFKKRKEPKDEKDSR